MPFLFFVYSYASGCEVVFHCGVICVSLMTNVVEDIFIPLLAIYISSLKKCLVKSRKSIFTVSGRAFCNYKCTRSFIVAITFKQILIGLLETVLQFS